MSEIGDLLSHNLLTYGLSPEQTDAIAALAKKETFAAGDYLTVLGARESDLFILIDGRVDVLTADNDKLGEIGPGGILGEIAFVDAGPRHAHAVAHGFVTAIRFPAKELRGHLAKDRQAGFMVLANLARLLAARLRNADGQLDQLMDLKHDVWENVL